MFATVFLFKLFNLSFLRDNGAHWESWWGNLAFRLCLSHLWGENWNLQEAGWL